MWLRRGLSTLSMLAAYQILPASAQTANSGLLGDMGGLRTILGKEGVTLGITDSENLLANVSGGVKQGATMQGVTTATLDVDTEKAFRLQGGTFHASALQIHGQSLSPSYLDDLQTANGNEAENATRLWELWYDQAFDESRADVKIGQQSIDNEFLVSQYSGLFVNTMAGWPLLPSSDLFGGGPAYPLSSLGVRGQFKPADNENILAGVFDDNPGGGAFSDDAQALDHSGTRFNLNTGALFIAEFQYAVNQPAVGDMVQAGRAPSSGLPGTYKIGFWYDTGAFPDQELGTDGLSLANPASNGNPIMHHGNYSLYAVMDQTVWQSRADSSRNLNIFARIMGAPATQNLIDFSFNGGVTLAAPFPGRDNDQAGIDFGLGKVSGRAASLDCDEGVTVQGTEALIELTYQAQVTPWLILQPDLQYVVNPGGGVLDPADPTHNLRNELVVGTRAVVTF
ncbi:MAG TPA: carbohydrate porin [Acidocella sp.]|uniref:carbohydrate porin n=1 Tax=Acidocella sp. TaxID=50710 RepID=UPI002C5CE6AD|nr:carbohydrate porin [Acidocella sp.]HVE21662.1 carbohydrate porin [Acidocella sp.]